ncbi:MAG: hypothetical protein KatS3mg053_0700 [Candidatus Roseilinea sp.]|nr:MAG: hypothetical protein KatS3mg053_0700 [Candidatus Roseilinea sp.]
MSDTQTLVIGAGPFGLSLAAYLSARGLDYRIVGRPMEFWTAHMPKGMYLRSGCDWHLDPDDEATIQRYLAERSITVAQATPLSLERYLDYARWFIERKRLDIWPAYVTRLERTGDAFAAELDDGSRIVARNVVVAIGFRYFANVPRDLATLLPAGRYAHTCDAVHLDAYAGRRVLIIGGRQSAFEWAALLREAGAQHVHLSYRHDTPRFVEADWSWVSPLVEGMVDDPAWFRRLSSEEQEGYRYRLWAEGRLKVEPWLDARVHQPNVTFHPRTCIVRAEVAPDGALIVTLDDGVRLEIDHIIVATGYAVDVQRVPFLAAGNLLDRLCIVNGYPCLDAHFQSSVPGLFFTSFAAGRDFGPFFGFTVSVRAAAKIVGRQLTSLAQATA